MTEKLLDIIGVFIFIYGACIGSFLNVVALRAFTGESFIFPSSKCPKCGAKIMPYDNIPIISWILLGGKCRNCKDTISMQYITVELITGLGFLFFYNNFKIHFLRLESVKAYIILLLFYLVIFCLSIIISITDFKEKVVFDIHTISLAVVIVLFNFFHGNFINTIIGLIVGALCMEILSGFGWLLIKKRAFGTGDSYIAAATGALLGWKMFLVSLTVAIIIQVLCIIPSFIKKLYINKEYKALISGAIFFVLLLIYKLPFYNPSMEVLQYVFAVVMTIVGAYLCKQILTIKTLKDNPTYWPFGPSLLISMFLVALYGGFIAHFLETLI